MLFNSYPFVALVLITAILYYLPPLRRYQRLVLVLASFIFYAANRPVLLLLLLFSICVNIGTSYLVVHGDRHFRKAYAVLGVVTNLSVLVFFKYSPLIGTTFFNRVETVSDFLITVPLPIGISFFTFQGISMMLDVFKADRGADPGGLVSPAFGKHAMDTALYISFFAQLVAGPIIKARDFIPQIKVKYLKDVQWERCYRALVLGYFLKMVVADNLKDQTFWITYPFFQQKSSVLLVAMLFAYSMQIFADFAGYSLIAIGLGHLFGYRLPANFNFPYVSESFAEFWKRWHISLSSFLKEYLYIPLGGNRKGRQRTYVNVMIVMLLGGLWHGAAWGYALWGSCHGAALAAERYLKAKICLGESLPIRVFKVLCVFVLVSAAWLLFKMPELSHSAAYVQSIFRNGRIHTQARHLRPIVFYALPVVFYHLHYLRRRAHGLEGHKKSALDSVVYGVMVFLILTNSGSPRAFVYFQF